MYHSKAWLVDDYRAPALETNITTTVTGAATWDPLFEPDPKIVLKLAHVTGWMVKVRQTQMALVYRRTQNGVDEPSLPCSDILIAGLNCTTVFREAQPTRRFAPTRPVMSENGHYGHI